jgi:hypothetical protein
MNEELKRIWWKMALVVSRYYTGISWKVLKKTENTSAWKHGGTVSTRM